MREWTQKHIEELCLKVIKRYLSGQTPSVTSSVNIETNNESTQEGGNDNETEQQSL